VVTPNDRPLWRPCGHAFSKHGGTPVARGAMTAVSADRPVDARTNAPSYLVRLTGLGDERRKLAGLQLVPGMPTEVLVRKGERTLLDYLLGPLEDTIRADLA